MRNLGNNIKITVNNLMVSYNDEGPDGAPVIIFIHGFPFNKSMWIKQAGALKNNYRVITYDVRGHGNSNTGTGDFSIELFANDLLSLMDSLKIIKAMLCGLSIGYTIGATLGASMAAQDRKVILFVGDGSFQVTCQDLSTMISKNLKPIIFLINNDGNTIERVIVDRLYNDIQPWHYHKLVEVFGGAPGLDVRTESELEDALSKANKSDGLVFIEIHTGRFDCPESLINAGRSMAKINKIEQ